MDIKKLQNIVEKVDYNFSDKKAFLEKDINLQLIKLLKEDNILGVLEDSKLKNILATFLGSKIKNLIIENKETFLKQTNKNFYEKIVIPNLSPLNIEKSIIFWENLTKEYKRFLKERVKDILKNINIKDYLIIGIVNSLVKKDNIGKLYLFFATNFIDSLSKKDNNYLRINKFLVNYFSGHQIIIGVRRYIMPTFKSNLFKNYNIKKILDEYSKVVYKINEEEGKLKGITNIIITKETEINNYKKLLIKEENKLYLKEQEKNNTEKKIISIRKEFKKKYEQLNSLSIINSIKIPGMKKEIKELKKKETEQLRKYGSIKEQLKDIKHKIFLAKGKTENNENILEKRRTEKENIEKDLNNLKNTYIKALKELTKNLYKKKKAL